MKGGSKHIQGYHVVLKDIRMEIHIGNAFLAGFMLSSQSWYSASTGFMHCVVICELRNDLLY